ncbi:MAG: RNA polymerase factor sigma-54 [Alphaproteobacteria bacterium]
MSVVPRLELRQGQALIMTPQLQQAIKLLQLSNMELAEFIHQEVEKNPFLEMVDKTGSQKAEIVDERPASLAFDDHSNHHTPDLDANFANVWNNAEDNAHTGMMSAQRHDPWDNSEEDFTARIADKPCLRSHLEEQLGLEFFEQIERQIGFILIDHLDDSGYLQANIEVIAKEIGCEESLVATVLAKLQLFDPPGIMARNLQECLTIQLREQQQLTPAFEKLLAHLELAGRHEWQKLASICGVPLSDIQAMMRQIKSLNPKPGSNFDYAPLQTMIPDVLVKRTPEGGWKLQMNNASLPKVLVNKQYFAEISPLIRRQQEKNYVAEKIQTANWLVKALDQRANTILKVATEIVQQQEGFFLYGVRYLRPMILKQVAEAAGVHESTVSRVTHGKYMATPRGIFELKFFFSSGINTSGGLANISAESVRQRIKQLIDAETSDNILSDDDLAALLAKEGIDIARRTVAKYREAMRIPVSSQRRRIKSS